MPARLSPALKQGVSTFQRFTVGQKAAVGLAIAGLVIGGVFVNSWAAKPSYAPLFSGLSAADASKVVDQVSSDGVPYKLTDGGGTIMVPQDKVFAERLAVSGKGITTTGSDGWSLFDKQGVTSSDFQQQVAYQRAIEGELQKTIESIAGVQAAVVNLAIPQQSVFTDTAASPTASVLISSTGSGLAPEQVDGIVNLVASSVQGLKPENVTITDGTGRILSSSSGSSTSIAGDNRARQIADYQTNVDAALQDMLDKVLGPGHSAVRVTADLDFDKTLTTTESYSSNPKVLPLSVSAAKETWKGIAPTVGGVLGGGTGTATGTGGVATGSTSGTGSYIKSNSTTDNAVDKVVEQRENAPGAIRKLNVAVILDSATIGTIKPAQIQALVSSAVGITPARGDTIQVSSLPFDKTAAVAAAQQLKDAKKAQSSSSMMGLIKQVVVALLVLLIIGFFLITGRRKSSGGLTEEERVRVEQLRTDLEAYELEVGSRSAIGGAGYPAGALLPGGRGGDPALERITAMRESVTDLIENQPEQVAHLLRGWLADRRTP